MFGHLCVLVQVAPPQVVSWAVCGCACTVGVIVAVVVGEPAGCKNVCGIGIKLPLEGFKSSFEGECGIFNTTLTLLGVIKILLGRYLNKATSCTIAVVYICGKPILHVG